MSLGSLRSLLTLLALPVFTGGCHAWRIETPLPARNTMLLNTETSVAARDDLEAVSSLVVSCYGRLRSVTQASSRLQARHMRIGIWVGMTANTVALAATIAKPRDRFDPFLNQQRNQSHTARIAVGVGASALALTYLDLVFNPSVRAARARSSSAMTDWISIRRSINRWEAVAKAWDSAMASGDTTTASTAKAAWNSEDAQLRILATECTQDRRD